MRLKNVAKGDTQLTYSLLTVPAPVCASASSTSPSSLALIFVVSCPRSIGSVNVSQIEIALPVAADDPAALLMTAPTVAAATISSTGADAWTPSLGATPGYFIFNPTHGQPVTVTTQALTIMLAGLFVSPLVGTADVRVAEWTAASGPPPKGGMPTGMATVEIAKFPTGFFVANFAAQSPQVASGQPVTLTWQGSTDAVYDIAFGDQTVPVSSVRTWTSPPLFLTTTFILRVSSYQDQQTVGVELSTTVIVATPTILEYAATPDMILYGDNVALSWQTQNATGVTIQTPGGLQTYGPTSDASEPVTITPEWGWQYALQAFDGGGSSRMVSNPQFLSIDWKPLVIQKFTASPGATGIGFPVTLAWNVDGAKSIHVAGQDVTATPVGSLVVYLDSSTSYTLSAYWVDGTVQTKTLSVGVPPNKATLYGDYVQNGTSITITISPQFAFSWLDTGLINNAQLSVEENGSWVVISEGPPQSGRMTASGNDPFDTTGSCTLKFTCSRNVAASELLLSFNYYLNSIYQNGSGPLKWRLSTTDKIISALWPWNIITGEH